MEIKPYYGTQSEIKYLQRLKKEGKLHLVRTYLDTMHIRERWDTINSDLVEEAARKLLRAG